MCFFFFFSRRLIKQPYIKPSHSLCLFLFNSWSVRFHKYYRYKSKWAKELVCRGGGGPQNHGIRHCASTNITQLLSIKNNTCRTQTYIMVVVVGGGGGLIRGHKHITDTVWWGGGSKEDTYNRHGLVGGVVTAYCTVSVRILLNIVETVPFLAAALSSFLPLDLSCFSSSLGGSFPPLPASFKTNYKLALFLQ